MHYRGGSNIRVLKSISLRVEEASRKIRVRDLQSKDSPTHAACEDGRRGWMVFNQKAGKVKEMVFLKISRNECSPANILILAQ